MQHSNIGIYVNIETSVSRTRKPSLKSVAAAVIGLIIEYAEIIINAIITTNDAPSYGLNGLEFSRRYDRCDKNQRWSIYRRQFCSTGK